MNREQLDRLSNEIIGAAIEVHKILGQGLLESSYRLALMYELKIRGINVQTEVPISLNYKGVNLGVPYRADLIVEDSIIVEIKSTENKLPLFAKQLYTYLKIYDKRLGLLINFNFGKLSEGIKRVVNKF